MPLQCCPCTKLLFIQAEELTCHWIRWLLVVLVGDSPASCWNKGCMGWLSGRLLFSGLSKDQCVMDDMVVPMLSVCRVACNQPFAALSFDMDEVLWKYFWLLSYLENLVQWNDAALVESELGFEFWLSVVLFVVNLALKLIWVRMVFFSIFYPKFAQKFALNESEQIPVPVATHQPFRSFMQICTCHTLLNSIYDWMLLLCAEMLGYGNQCNQLIH